MRKQTQMNNDAMRLATAENVNLDAELASLLTVYYPCTGYLPKGQAYYAPEDIKLFDALFHRFGLELSSHDDQFDDDDYLRALSDRLVIVFGSYLEGLPQWPKIVERRFALMPPGFPDYIRAVLVNDRSAAMRLAAQLDVANMDAFCVKGLMEG
ncbi:MAG: hypothetical protein M3Y65_25005 [Pseudomonadota bacterium]|nr:hypothetical protein [Pseudomonadota bacterium]